VILALGRRGTPRKLGVPGEELSKVMYQVRDAEEYRGKQILFVGGGDSAVEAAMGLAHQKGNKVTLVYRQAEFSRIKERNAQRIRTACAAAR
jgi:thioredoxin reductase